MAGLCKAGAISGVELLHATYASVLVVAGIRGVGRCIGTKMAFARLLLPISLQLRGVA